MMTTTTTTTMTMMTTTKRPVGFLMAQALTMASSSALFGIAGYLNIQADVAAQEQAALESSAALSAANLELTTVAM
ncbi:hypothetical protein N8964_00875, partial [Pontimonas sp.]|nr:hypothetical protein [Pontimonas sp.]MDA7814768.1 hypothetical protein [Pontimonas sp.]